MIAAELREPGEALVDEEVGAVLRRLTTSLHAQIPMTSFLRLSITLFEQDRIALAAPLSPSRNHRGTAFGPGVFTAAGLAPWLLLVRRAWAEHLPVQILLRRSEFAIHRPIPSAYLARCEGLPTFEPGALEDLRRGDKVRLTATAHVRFDDGAAAATYTAHYTLVPVDGSGGSSGVGVVVVSSAGPGGGPGAGVEGDLQLPFPEAWRR